MFYGNIHFIMMLTYSFKLYTTRGSRRLKKLIDIAGLIYNHCIALHKRYFRLYGKHLHKYTLTKHLVKLKRTRRFAYIRKLDAQAVEDIAFRIDRAYKLFFTMRRKGRKASPPNFRKIKRYSSFTLRMHSWKLDETAEAIMICGKRYRYIKTRSVTGRIKTVTIKRDALGDMYIYLACDAEARENIQRTGEKVGYDFGLKTFLTASDGKDIASPLFFTQNARTIRKLNRRLARKKPGSRRRERSRRELARAYRRASDQRRDFHFKTARKICGTYAVVCIESLNIAGMKKLWGRKVSDLAFYSFVQILKHEASKLGTQVIEIDRYYPSSQMCSVCGYQNKATKDLRIRRWTCPVCGAVHDRDRNAAVNILRAGVSASAGEPIRHPAKRAQVH